jgi:hypothetical protein
MRVFLLIACLVASLYLNYRQRDIYTLQAGRLARITAPRPTAVGSSTNGWMAMASSGKLVSVAGAGSTLRIVYWMSPSCLWSLTDRHVVEALRRQLSIPFVAVADSDAPGNTSTFPYPILRSDDRARHELLQLSATPTTLLVDGDGTVTNVWRGPLSQLNTLEDPRLGIYHLMQVQPELLNTFASRGSAR